MLNKKHLLLFLFIFSFAFAHAQLTAQKYIELYKDLAIEEMNRTGIPASITLAQALLESSNGNSKLATQAKNHFGIKCHSSWKGKKIYKDDDKKHECFRKYKHVLASYKDHSDFLTRYNRYAFLFQYKTTDYKKWAKGLKKAGYATNPAYATRLIKLIERYKLNKYDQGNLIADNPSPKKKKRKIKHNYSKEEYAISLGRKIYKNNRIKYIIAKSKDTYSKLSKEFEMLPWEIYKYNDVKKGDDLTKGTIVYLQPKRNKAAKNNDYHIVKKGESLHSISQKYGIKLRKLLKKNRLKENATIHVGDKLWLRKRKKNT